MKIRVVGLIMAIVSLFSVFAVGCGDGSGTECYIQYTDDEGVHQITVTNGSFYSLDSIPQREGYEFLGLFDKAEGGTQYVGANGSSLDIYMGKKSMTLYPQFRVREYTVILDFQGAEVTGSRQFSVPYGASLPELPKNLTLEHSTFSGWYTMENCGGVQVADNFGLIPVSSVLNGKNFDLSGEYVYLYAGFEIEKYDVTLNFGDGLPAETIKVGYNTPIKNIIYKTRSADGKAVYSWSESETDETKLFTGRVTKGMELYAVEWANVIDFDTDGGKEIAPIIERYGAGITLPTPTRDMYKFVCWEKDGTSVNFVTMPAEGMTLKAVWNAKLIFDSNGGQEIDPISEKAGTSIKLPSPEKEGYIFAGWYTADKDKYESTVMPSVSAQLKAGWYKAKEQTKIYIPSDDYEYAEGSSEPNIQVIDMKKIDPDADFSGKTTIKLHIHFKSHHYASGMGYSGYTNLNYGIYSESKRSDSTTLFKKIFEHNNLQVYQTRDFDATIDVKDGVFYIIYDKATQSAFRDVAIADYYIVYKYPDTSKLYL